MTAEPTLVTLPTEVAVVNVGLPVFADAVRDHYLEVIEQIAALINDKKLPILATAAA